jgi:hypothetical protein
VVRAEALTNQLLDTPPARPAPETFAALSRSPLEGTDREMKAWGAAFETFQEGRRK